MKEIIYDSDYMDMNLGFAYRFLNNQSVLTTAHAHNYYEYFLVTSGTITHIVNGKRDQLDVGDLVLIRPSDYHSYQLNKKTECELINVSFSAHHFYAACQYLGREMERQFLSPLYPPKINIRPFADCTLDTDHSFLNFYVGNNAELYIRLRMLLVETLVTFIRYAQFKQGKHYDEWLYRILEQMTTQENLEEGVPALLRLSGFSHGHLCRIMKQQVGHEPESIYYQAAHGLRRQSSAQFRQRYSDHILKNRLQQYEPFYRHLQKVLRPVPRPLSAAALQHGRVEIVSCAPAGKRSHKKDGSRLWNRLFFLRAHNPPIRQRTLAVYQLPERKLFS